MAYTFAPVLSKSQRDNVTVVCNNHMRDLLRWEDLTDAERREFDYYTDNESGLDTDTAQFFRYRGETYDLGQFSYPAHDVLARGFHGILTDSAFSATVVRYFDSEGFDLTTIDSIIVGRMHW